MSFSGDTTTGQEGSSRSRLVQVSPSPTSQNSDFEHIINTDSNSKVKLVQVSPSPNSQNSDFEVLSMSDDIADGETPVSSERKIRFASVVYSNPHGGEETTIELSRLPDQDGGSSNGIEEIESLRDSVSSPTTTYTAHMDQQVLQDVLDTRPTLQLGRNMSMRFRSPSAYVRRSRGASSYSSLPPRSFSAVGAREDISKSTTLPGNYRKESDMTVEGRPSILTLEDIEGVVWDEEEDDEQGFGFKEGAKYRQSTRRLKDRIDLQRESNLREDVAIVRDSPWDRFIHVKWPKFKSRAKVCFSWSLWKGHMKEVEGHFGTAVVSYFIFLRFLFVLNFIIFAMWFGLVVIPGALFLVFDDPPNAPSQLACAYSTDLLPQKLCSTDDPANAANNESILSLVIHYQLVLSGNYTCEPAVDGFLVQSCAFGDSFNFNDSFLYEVAEREGDETISVSSIRPDEMECVFEGSNLNITELRLCSTDINPRYQWYEYIVDFVLGQGLFNDTLLFYGRYGNQTINRGLYSMPLAYLLMTGVIYALSVVLLVYKLGRAYNESYTQFSTKRKINFSNKLFTAWDFNITHPNTAKLQRVHIRTNFEEEISDYDKRSVKRTNKELAIVIIIRIFVNLFTFVILIAGAVTIYFAALYGLENQSSNSLSFEGLVLPVVITTLNLFLPFFFSFLALIERFKTQSGEIKMTLLRAIMVRMSSLIVLVITLFTLVSCTQQVENVVTSTATMCAAFSTQALNDIVSNSSTINECPTCWETFIGQEIYKLGLTNFVVSIASTIAVETSRNIASRIKFKGLGEKLGKGNFNIAKSILDLIYTQALLWLGFFFSPMLPVVIMSTTFILFYVKKYSLMINLTPNKRGAFRAARTNFLFVLIMLLSLFLILVPIGYVVANFIPSPSCGPFRGDPRIHTIIDANIDSLTCSAQQFFDFIGSVGFVLPLLILLMLVIYSQYVILRARKERFQLIKKQLVLEGANVMHIVGKLDGVLQKMAEQRAVVTEGMTNIQHHSHLRQRIVDIRNSISETGETTTEASL